MLSNVMPSRLLLAQPNRNNKYVTTLPFNPSTQPFIACLNRRMVSAERHRIHRWAYPEVGLSTRHKCPRGSIVHAYSVFADIDDSTTEDVIGQLPVIQVAAGDVVIREGEENHKVYLIESGQLGVWKGEPGKLGALRVATLRADDCFGEMSALAGGQVSATLTAETPAVLRTLALSNIADDKLRREIVLNVSKILIQRLGGANDLSLKEHNEKIQTLQLQVATSSLLTKSLMLLSAYIFIFAISIPLNKHLPSPSIVSSFLILMFFFVILHFLLSSGIPLAVYGMTLENWRWWLYQAVVYSIPFAAVFVIIKLTFSAIYPATFHLFEPDRMEKLVGTDSVSIYAAVGISYALLTFAQEFIRCTVQRSLHLFSVASEDRKDKGLQAMLVANVVFASLHVHLGPLFALGAFIGGLFWGWMYLRTNSYLATAFSHAMVGSTIVFVFGVPF
jgi:CRP/FNR family transcriptional regulator, cyclic AMP receptor protein